MSYSQKTAQDINRFQRSSFSLVETPILRDVAPNEVVHQGVGGNSCAISNLPLDLLWQQWSIRTRTKLLVSLTATIGVRHPHTAGHRKNRQVRRNQNKWIVVPLLMQLTLISSLKSTMICSIMGYLHSTFHCWHFQLFSHFSFCSLKNVTTMAVPWYTNSVSVSGCQRIL